MLAPDLVRALPNRCLRDMRMVIAHLLGVTPVLAARRGRTAVALVSRDAKLTTPASPDGLGRERLAALDHLCPMM
jgi:hypothetical protein